MDGAGDVPAARLFLLGAKLSTDNPHRGDFRGQYFWPKFRPACPLPLIARHFKGFASMDFQPMLPPTPRHNRRVRSGDFSTLRVADFYMGPSNDAARLSVPPTCPVGQSTASLPRRGFAPAQTSATSRITRFSWQQPHVRLIAIATSAVWNMTQFQTPHYLIP